MSSYQNRSPSISHKWILLVSNFLSNQHTLLHQKKLHTTGISQHEPCRDKKRTLREQRSGASNKLLWRIQIWLGWSWHDAKAWQGSQRFWCLPLSFAGNAKTPLIHQNSQAGIKRAVLPQNIPNSPFLPEWNHGFFSLRTFWYTFLRFGVSVFKA